MPGKLKRKKVFIVIVLDLYSIAYGDSEREFFFKYAKVAPAAFSSLEKAKKFVETLCSMLREDFSGEWVLEQKQRFDKLPLDVIPGFNSSWLFRVQISETLMPSQTITDEDLIQSMAFEELTSHTWCYNVDGDLLWESPHLADEASELEYHLFEERYKVGDRVYVIPQALEPESESIEGELAVVSKAPVSMGVWLDTGHERESWNPFYTVDFIDDEGYLGQYHVPESSLLLATFSLPEHYARKRSFLPLWSKFLREELAFPDGLADRIRARKVHLYRRPRYDFDAGVVVE